MRTFSVECPECDTDLDVQIEEADLLDPETTHAVVCEECQLESEFEYDATTDDLMLVVDDEDEDDEPEATDAAEEEEDD
jgi:hypothetical protein